MPTFRFRLMVAGLLGLSSLAGPPFSVQAAGQPDVGDVDRQLSALRSNPQDPGVVAFFRNTPFDRLWPQVKKADDDSQIRCLLLLRYLDDPNPKPRAELMGKKGDAVLRLAQATYWPIVVFPLREDGAYEWATLAAQWDANSRTLTNIVRMSIEKRYGSGALMHFKQEPQYAVTDGGAGKASWGFRGDYPWDQIIGELLSQPVPARSFGWVANVFTESSGIGSVASPAHLTRRWRIAVLASPEVRKKGLDDLVCAALQKIENLETLERTEVDTLLDEHEKVALFAAGPGRLQLPNFTGADALLLLNLENHGGTNTLKETLSDCGSGALMGLDFRSWPPSHLGQAADEAAKLAVAVLARFPRGVERVVGLGQIRCRNLEYTYDHLQIGFTRLIQFGFMQKEGIAAMDLEEATALRSELQQTGRTRVNVQLPVFVQGEFEVKGTPPARQTVELAIKVTDSASTVRSIGSSDLALEAVPEYLTMTLPREVLAGSSSNASLSSDRQFALLVARAEEWDRLAEWNMAAELREAALLIKPEAAKERLRLVLRHKDPAERRVHLEYLIRHGQIDRPQATALFCDVTPVVAPTPLMFFSDELQKKMLRRRQQKIGDLTRVYPLILGLPAGGASTNQEVENWGEALQRLLIAEDVEMYKLVLSGITTSPEAPDMARRFAEYLLDPAAVASSTNGVSPVACFVKHYHHPPSKEALRSLRKSKYPMDLFFVASSEMRDTTLSPKVRYLAANQVVRLLEEHSTRGRWFVSPTDNHAGYNLMQKARKLLMGLASQVEQEPAKPMVYSLRFPAPGFPEQKPTEIVKEGIPLKVRRLTGQVVEVLPFGQAADQRPNVLNCGTFDVLWSQRELLLQREPGVVIEVLADFEPRLSDVKWDGKFFWLGTLNAGVWVANSNGKVLNRIGASDGLPPVTECMGYNGSRGLYLEPTATGRVCVVGQVAKDPKDVESPVRTWCAMLDFNGTIASVDVFHEARRVITDSEKAESLLPDQEFSFTPMWIRHHRDPQTGKDYVYIGRYSRTRMWWGMQNRPLRVEVATRRVTVDPAPPAFSPPALPERYEAVRKLLDDFNYTGWRGWSSSALHGPIVFEWDQVRLLRLALKEQGATTMLPLYVAAERGDVELVKRHLAAGGDVDRGDNESPLGWACLRAHVEVARLLLEAGAKVDHIEPYGTRRQALHHVLVGPTDPGRLELVNMLLAKGADKNAQEYSGYTPLHLAIIMGHEKEAAVLVDAGADLEKVDNEGRTALHLAAWFGRESLGRVLLGKGAKVGATDKGGQTPLHYAARKGNVSMITLLIEHGAQVEFRDSAGDSPLQKAVWSNQISAVTVLLDKKADINSADSTGLTSLKCASLLDHKEMVSLLRRHGAVD